LLISGMRALLRMVEVLALAWWLFAIKATALFTIHLPYNQGRRPMPGCFLDTDWVTYVECGSTLGADTLEGFLTWGRFWTVDLEVFSLVPPLVVIWLGSIILASCALFSLGRSLMHLHQSRS
jgi:hypothetical protein